MKTIYANYITVALRIGLATVFIFLFGIVVNKFLHGRYDDLHPIVYVGFAAFMMFPVILFRSLFGVFGLKYSAEQQVIYVWKFPTGETQIPVSNIAGFYHTHFSTRARDYPGYFLKFHNGQSVELPGYNLDGLLEFQYFLEENGVPCLGQKSSWFPFKRKL